MLKINQILTGTGFESTAHAKLQQLLMSIPFLSMSSSASEPPPIAKGLRPDFVLSLFANGEPWQLIVECKSDGQPRHIRSAALQVKDYVRQIANAHTYPMVMAPFISPASAEICKEAGVGFADLAGNCHIAFDRVFIDRSVAENPYRKRRVQRSIFSPKSARILRLLLADPASVWRVAQLAEQAQVSLGQVSNLRRRLLDEEWAALEKEGLRIAKPRELLDAWRQAYRPEPLRSQSFYTLLHGEALDSAVRAALAEAGQGEHALLFSYSAGRWLAPYARVASLYLYADAKGEGVLRKRLQLEPPGRGANVSLVHPKDDGVFLDRLEAADGLWCTSPIQTYLDLAVSGERGAEAAEHLFNERIAPRWKSTQ